MFDKLSRPLTKVEPETQSATINRKPEKSLTSPSFASSAAEDRAAASASPLVNDALEASGQPLDAETQAFFAPRFNFDFSKVRVHTDARAAESAQSAAAYAYTAGSSIVFGANRYQPQTLAGRFLLAHELAHVVQQQDASANAASEDASLEHVADRAAADVTLGGATRVAPVSSAPAVQFLKVSSGAFGKALEEFTNWRGTADATIKLLQKSASFMNMVSVMDSRYVWASDLIAASGKPDVPNFDFDQTGKISQGPPGMVGKRALQVSFDRKLGARFLTHNNPENGLTGDAILLADKSESDFIQKIAHETAHAVQFVSSSAPAPATMTDEINAGIQDEIGARKKEAKALKDVPDKNISALAASVGALDTAQVERSFAESYTLTYVELFFFSRRLREAMAEDKLDNDSAQQMSNEVDSEFTKNPNGPPYMTVPDPAGGKLDAISKYGNVLINRTRAANEWKDFLAKNKPSDPGFEAKKEKLLQDHVTTYLEGKVSYTPLPTPTATPTATP